MNRSPKILQHGSRPRGKRRRTQEKHPPRPNPLMVYTLEAASMALKLTRVVVSTEDEEIERVARLHGTQVLTRPPALARDETPGIEPVLHAISDFLALTMWCYFNRLRHPAKRPASKRGD